MLTIETTRVVFLEDDVWEGSLPREAYDNARTETEDIEPEVPGLFALALAAVRALREAGTTEDNGTWFSDPEGSYVSNYYTGERTETSARFLWNGAPIEDGNPQLAALISAANVPVRYRGDYRPALTALHRIGAGGYWDINRRAELIATAGL